MKNFATVNQTSELRKRNQGTVSGRAAESAALGGNSARLAEICGDDRDLAQLIAAWAELAVETRAEIMRLVRQAAAQDVCLR